MPGAFRFWMPQRKSLKATRSDALVLGVVLGVLFVAALLAMRHRGTYTDELNHYAQIVLFRRGEFRVFTAYLTTIPGYHAIVAAILSMFGARIARCRASRQCRVRADRRRRLPRACDADSGPAPKRSRPRSCSCCRSSCRCSSSSTPTCSRSRCTVVGDVRDDHVTSLAFRRAARRARFACARTKSSGPDFSRARAIWPLWRERGFARDGAKSLCAWLPYCVPVAAFLAFWWWNGSISLSREQSALHPDVSLHAGNVFFALFIAGVLLPLQAIAGLGDFVDRARASSLAVCVPPLRFRRVFWWGFHADNPYNSVFPNYYIRNGLLLAIDAQPLLAPPSAHRHRDRRVRPRVHAPRSRPPRTGSIPFAALFLAASWLIEQRYTLVPLVLWLAFREHRGRAIEWATAALWLVLAVLVFQGMIAIRFFL